MNMRIIDGGAHSALATSVAEQLGVSLTLRTVSRFPDGEAHVRLLETVDQDDVFIVQPTQAPQDAHLVELLLLADAAKRGGARRVTAVFPYFGYARQDHDGGRPIAASVLVRMIEAAGIDHVIVIDLHSRTTEMAFRVSVSHLTALSLLAERLRTMAPRDGIIVAPDLGAAERADRFARILGLPVAFVRKRRLNGSDVEAHGVTGDVRGRSPVIVDDMISTGGTIVAAAGACFDAGANETVFVAASHALFAGPATRRLRALPLRGLLITDSVPLPEAVPARCEVVTVAELIAGEIAKVHGGIGNGKLRQPERAEEEAHATH